MLFVCIFYLSFPLCVCVSNIHIVIGKAAATGTTRQGCWWGKDPSQECWLPGVSVVHHRSRYGRLAPARKRVPSLSTRLQGVSVYAHCRQGECGCAAAATGSAVCCSLKVWSRGSHQIVQRSFLLIGQMPFINTWYCLFYSCRGIEMPKGVLGTGATGKRGDGSQVFGCRIELSETWSGDNRAQTIFADDQRRTPASKSCKIHVDCRAVKQLLSGFIFADYLFPGGNIATGIYFECNRQQFASSPILQFQPKSMIGADENCSLSEIVFRRCNLHQLDASIFTNCNQMVS